MRTNTSQNVGYLGTVSKNLSEFIRIYIRIYLLI